MTPEDRHTLEAFAGAVRARYPEAEVVAFGSRARGDARPYSDLDVCVVLERPVDRPLKEALRDVAFEIGFERERVITLVVYERTRIERGPLSASPLLASIRREGVPA